MIGTFVYWSLMKAYNLLIFAASLFNPKAKQWIKGRKQIFRTIQESLANDDTRRVWFHCASLGEFEQARPVIELFRQEFPQYKVILTFFSPSGYENKKDCKLVDWTFYLPLDTPKNARQLVGLFKPSAVFFSKYDFWYFILKELDRRQIPVILFSAIFRENQLFFKKIGRWYKNLLTLFTHIFVQDDISYNLLKKHGIENVTIAGDTRFDRVVKISRTPSQLPCIEKFVQGADKVIVAGSTYIEDAKILADYILSHKDTKLIIAPHEITGASISETMNLFYSGYALYSMVKQSKHDIDKQVLIIDAIGLLSKIYRYATVTYVGGGFNGGIHNILEAVVYGKPVVFGPKYGKFKEALDLLDLGVAFTIRDNQEFFTVMEDLLGSPRKLEEIRKISLDYINRHVGSSQKIIGWFKRKKILD